MIDWTKPIETTKDGTPARVLGLLSLSMASLPSNRVQDPFEPMMVWVESDCNSWGNIFLINNQGYRCDDRAIYSSRQEPLIRNARVKRVAWCLVSPKYCIVNRREYYGTEELAKEAALPDERIAKMEWEE